MASSSSSSSSSNVAAAARQARLFRKTPLVYSPTLSKLCDDQPVYLKLDCLQASGSFKDRGMAHLCWTLRYEQGVQKLISSSGGNAGLAVATVGQQLGMDVQVVVPETTKPLVVSKLQSLGADVTIHGENWNAADALARQWVQDSDGQASYISPYDNPLLWTGHSTLVDEIVDDLQQLTGSSSLGTLIVSVGGGGLLCGVLEGLERHAAATNGQLKTRVIAAETVGASSFGQAWAAGNVVRLSSIDSIATSLGALEVTPVALQRAKQEAAGCKVEAAQCTDAQAVQACWALAQDHRLLVEPACGAALAVAYSESLRNQFLNNTATDDDDDKQRPIVIQVCGGSAVTIDLLMQWKDELNL